MPNFALASTPSLYSDPVVLDWAIGEVDDTEFASNNKRKWVLDTFFNDLAIHHHLNSLDGNVIGRMLSHVPVERFRNHLDALVDRWPTWTDTPAWRGAEVIAELDPSAAANLFETYLSQTANQQHGDISKLLGIVESLRHIDGEQGFRLFEILAEQVSSIEDSHFSGWVLSGMLVAGLRLDRPDTGDLIQRLLASGMRDEESLPKALNRIMGAMVGRETELPYVRDFMMGYTDQILLPLGEDLFVPEAHLDEADVALLELQDGDTKAAQGLIERYLFASPAPWIGETFQTSTALRVFKEIAEGKIEIKIDDKRRRPWRHAFAIAGLLSGWKLPEIKLAELSMQRFLDVLTADLELPSALCVPTSVAMLAPVFDQQSCLLK